MAAAQGCFFKKTICKIKYFNIIANNKYQFLCFVVVQFGGNFFKKNLKNRKNFKFQPETGYILCEGGHIFTEVTKFFSPQRGV